jgi:hypothetical protein
VTPTSVNSFFRKVLVKTTSLSLTILLGMPSKRACCRRKPMPPMSPCRGVQWDEMHVLQQSVDEVEDDRFPIDARKTFDKIHGDVWPKSPRVGRSCFPLLRWQTSQVCTKSCTAPLSLEVCKSAQRRCRVFSVPSCRAPWACASMARSKGDADATNGRSRIVMRSLTMRQALLRSPVATAALSA